MTTENRTEETTDQAEDPVSPGEAKYPDLLRMGHVFVTSVGHRNFVEGFYGALDVAIGGDGWYYVLNKVDPRLRLFEKLRFAKVDLNDQYEPNIFPSNLLIPSSHKVMQRASQCEYFSSTSPYEKEIRGTLKVGFQRPFFARNKPTRSHTEWAQGLRYGMGTTPAI